MAYRRGLAGRVRGMPGCPTQISGRSVCMAGRRAGLCPRDITPRPGTPEFDRPTWTIVFRPRLLQMVQPVLRAVSRPDGEKAVIVVLEATAATHGDEPRIPDLGKDHKFAEARSITRVARLRASSNELTDRTQSGYSSLRQARSASGGGFGVRSSRKLKYGATNGSGAVTV
jgi:hypothetical protein